MYCLPPVSAQWEQGKWTLDGKGLGGVEGEYKEEGGMVWEGESMSSRARMRSEELSRLQ